MTHPAQRLFTCYTPWHQNYHSDPQPFTAAKHNGTLLPVSRINNMVLGPNGYVPPSRGTRQVPTLASTDTLSAYLEQYGKECLFTALTGRIYGDCFGDVAWQELGMEFQAAMEVGLGRWEPFRAEVMLLREEIAQGYQTRWGLKADNDLMQTNRWGRPIFRQGLFVGKLRHYYAYPFRCLPTLDPVADDLGLERMYAFLDHDAVWPEDWEKEPFPVSVEGRLTHFFGAATAARYKRIMEYFNVPQ